LIREIAYTLISTRLSHEQIEAILNAREEAERLIEAATQVQLDTLPQKLDQETKS
jgi:hypothetical protein